MSEKSLPPQMGDEERLFERYGARLRRVTQLAVNTSPDIVDDACAHAWMKLLTNQPRRETAFSWLKVVARNEAWRLDGLARGMAPLGSDEGEATPTPGPAARRARIETAQDMLELRERLAQLPPRQREVVFLNAAGWRFQDIAEREGISHTRVSQLLAKASARMREMDIREHDPTSPRAHKLRELEETPPRYLIAAIGRPLNGRGKVGHEEVRREWRRLAISIEDFRGTHGVTDPIAAIGKDPNIHGLQDLAGRIKDFRKARGLSRGIER